VCICVCRTDGSCDYLHLVYLPLDWLSTSTLSSDKKGGGNFNQHLFNISCVCDYLLNCVLIASAF
jgi:hypothetical protein